MSGGRTQSFRWLTLVGLFHLVFTSQALADGGRIKVWSSQDQALLFVDDRCFGRYRQGETKPVDLPTGKHEVRISLDGFRDYVQQVKLAPGSNLNIAATLIADPTMRHSGVLTLTSTPSETTVRLCGEALPTPTPLVVRNLPHGLYPLRFEKELHHPAELEVRLSPGEEEQVQARLKPGFGYLSVSSAPSGARVYLANRIVGRTPLKRLQVLSGVHELKLEKDLHRTIVREVTVRDDEEVHLSDKLPTFAGTLDLQSEPAVSSVYVNDQFRGKTPLILQLTPGQYSIQFVPEVNTYRSCTEQIVVLEARTTTLHKTLEVGFGTLSVRTTPDNANIFLSSTYYGLNKRFYGRSSTKLRNLPAGLYRLQLELDDYRTESLDLIIGDEETTEVELHLVRDRRSLKYGLLGGAGLTLVASVGMGYWAIPRAYSTHEEAEERYAEYREVFVGSRLESKWRRYREIVDESRFYKLVSLGAIAGGVLSSVGLLYALSIPAYDHEEVTWRLEPEEFGLRLSCSF